MPFMRQRMGMLRNQTRPGDIVLKMNPRSNLGSGWNQWGKREALASIISKVSPINSEYTHGGIAVGGSKLIEVSGSLPKDSRGNKRKNANIYLTDLNTDTRRDSYDVFRCVDKSLAEKVAMEAFPFAAQGMNKAWNYNIQDAFGSTGQAGVGKFLGKFKSLSDKSGSSPVPEGFEVLLENGASALDVANLEKRQFFCTQFVVWLYNLVAEKERGQQALIPIPAHRAYPGMVAEALDKSGAFYYAGTIRGL